MKRECPHAHRFDNTHDNTPHDSAGNRAESAQNSGRERLKPQETHMCIKQCPGCQQNTSDGGYHHREDPHIAVHFFHGDSHKVRCHGILGSGFHGDSPFCPVEKEIEHHDQHDGTENDEHVKC